MGINGLNNETIMYTVINAELQKGSKNEADRTSLNLSLNKLWSVFTSDFMRISLHYIHLEI